MIWRINYEETLVLKESGVFSFNFEYYLCYWLYDGVLFLSSLLKTITVGIVYAIWADMGIVLIALISSIMYKQMSDIPAITDMFLIVSGVIVINVFSKNSEPLKIRHFSYE